MGAGKDYDTKGGMRHPNITVQCLYVCVCPVYMSCVHRSKVHRYKFCIVVESICKVIATIQPTTQNKTK